MLEERKAHKEKLKEEALLQNIREKEERIAKLKKNKIQTVDIDCFEPIESESPMIKDWVPTSDTQATTYDLNGKRVSNKKELGGAYGPGGKSYYQHKSRGVTPQATKAN